MRSRSDWLYLAWSPSDVGTVFKTGVSHDPGLRLRALSRNRANPWRVPLRLRLSFTLWCQSSADAFAYEAAIKRMALNPVWGCKPPFSLPERPSGEWGVSLDCPPGFEDFLQRDFASMAIRHDAHLCWRLRSGAKQAFSWYQHDSPSQRLAEGS